MDPDELFFKSLNGMR